MEGHMRRWGSTLVLAVAISLGGWGLAGCEDDDPAGSVGTDAGPPITPAAPVTIAFLQHGNPAYDVANGAAFRACEKAPENVPITTTTIECPSLTATLLTDLKNDRLAADLVQVPGNWICS